MQIPTSVMDRVRGPLLAVAVAGCSSSAAPAAEAPPTIPVTPTESVAVAPADPVPYDPTGEAERLARTDTILSAEESRRHARIADEEASRRRRTRRSLLESNQRHIIMLEALCGRG